MSSGQTLDFVESDFCSCCQGDLQILPHLQLPKKNLTDSGSSQIEINQRKYEHSTTGKVKPKFNPLYNAWALFNRGVTTRGLFNCRVTPGPPSG